MAPVMKTMTLAAGLFSAAAVALPAAHGGHHHHEKRALETVWATVTEVVYKTVTAPSESQPTLDPQIASVAPESTPIAQVVESSPVAQQSFAAPASSATPVVPVAPEPTTAATVPTTAPVQPAPIPSSSSPVNAPVSSPVNPPAESPIVAAPIPSSSPVNPPVSSPVNAPVSSPVNPPASSTPVATPPAESPIVAAPTPSSAQPAPQPTPSQPAEDYSNQAPAQQSPPAKSPSPSPQSHAVTAFDGLHIGKVTWYEDGGAYTSCGVRFNTYTDNVVALDLALSGTVSNGNPLCGRQVKATYNGKTSVGTVLDKCAACKLTHIDVSHHMMEELGINQMAEGVQWELL